MTAYGKCIREDPTTGKLCQCLRFKADFREGSDPDLCKTCAHDDGYHKQSSGSAGTSLLSSMPIISTATSISLSGNSSNGSRSSSAIHIPRIDPTLLQCSTSYSDQSLAVPPEAPEVSVQRATNEVFRAYPRAAASSRFQVGRPKFSRGSSSQESAWPASKKEKTLKEKPVRVKIMNVQFLLSSTAPVDPWSKGKKSSDLVDMALKMHSRGMRVNVEFEDFSEEGIQKKLEKYFPQLNLHLHAWKVWTNLGAGGLQPVSRSPLGGPVVKDYKYLKDAGSTHQNVVLTYETISSSMLRGFPNRLDDSDFDDWQSSEEELPDATEIASASQSVSSAIDSTEADIETSRALAPSPRSAACIAAIQEADQAQSEADLMLTCSDNLREVTSASASTISRPGGSTTVQNSRQSSKRKASGQLRMTWHSAVKAHRLSKFNPAERNLRHSFTNRTQWIFQSNRQTWGRQLLHYVRFATDNELLHIPEFTIHDGIAVDALGIMRTVVDTAFAVLLDDDHYFETLLSGMKHCKARSPSEYDACTDDQAEYEAFGAAVYWFVIHHAEVPWPRNLSIVHLTTGLHDRNTLPASWFVSIDQSQAQHLANLQEYNAEDRIDNPKFASTMAFFDYDNQSVGVF